MTVQRCDCPAGEFCHAMKPKQENLMQYSKREMLDAFKAFEHPDHKGKVHKNVLVDALTYYGATDELNREDVAQLAACLCRQRAQHTVDKSS